MTLSCCSCWERRERKSKRGVGVEIGLLEERVITITCSMLEKEPYLLDLDLERHTRGSYRLRWLRLRRSAIGCHGCKVQQ